VAAFGGREEHARGSRERPEGVSDEVGEA
jgi:hypothetical protein